MKFLCAFNFRTFFKFSQIFFKNLQIQLHVYRKYLSSAIFGIIIPTAVLYVNACLQSLYTSTQQNPLVEH